MSGETSNGSKLINNFAILSQHTDKFVTLCLRGVLQIAFGSPCDFHIVALAIYVARPYMVVLHTENRVFKTPTDLTITLPTTHIWLTILIWPLCPWCHPHSEQYENPDHRERAQDEYPRGSVCVMASSHSDGPRRNDHQKIHQECKEE